MTERLTPDEEHELRRQYLDPGGSKNATVEKLLRELGALRTDLAELVDGQPLCGDCGRLATRTSHGELFYCDNEACGWEELEEMATAPVIRRIEVARSTTELERTCSGPGDKPAEEDTPSPVLFHAGGPSK